MASPLYDSTSPPLENPTPWRTSTSASSSDDIPSLLSSGILLPSPSAEIPLPSIEAHYTASPPDSSPPLLSDDCPPSPTPYTTTFTRSGGANRSARRSSGAYTTLSTKTSKTDNTAISDLPPELPSDSRDFTPYTPHKIRPSVFRDPESVRRAMCMASPPPPQLSGHSFSGAAGAAFGSSPLPRSGSRSTRMGGNGKYGRLGTIPTRESMMGMGMGDVVTPGSEHSSFMRSSPQHERVRERVGGLEGMSRQGTPRSVGSAREETPRKNLPLVLLHVTLLHTACPYSAVSMQRVLSEKYGYVLRNWRLLEEKMSETVVARGLLIPHPGEEYDVLEEKLLESLELKRPRILKCGHYCYPEENVEDDESCGSRYGGCSERDVFVDGDDDEDEETCHECRRPIKYPGMGEGTKKWNVRIFAANGMMRAGAWSAAWREMERVDIEIEPWMPDEARRELDELREEEAIAEMRRIEEEVAAGRLREERLLHEAEMEATRRREEAMKERIRVDSAFSHRTEVPNLPHHNVRQRRPVSQLSARPSRPSTPTRSSSDKIPLSILLRNYLYLLTQDRRNIVIFLLSCTVLFFALSPRISKPPHLDAVSVIQDLPAYTVSGHTHTTTISSMDLSTAKMSIAPTLMPSVAVSAQTGHSQKKEEEEAPPSRANVDSSEAPPTLCPTEASPSTMASTSSLLAATTAPRSDVQTQTSQSESISEDKISASPVSMDVPSGQGSVHAAAPRAADLEGGDDATGDPDDDASSGISRRLELAEGLDEVEELLLDSL
ncbi:hypothetical protein LTS18_013651 [Coniosporium uncinatum]|uniref:Uncharacterized protein n=1 Tax=Coniosporium uncinatum TaxID=93489 RepID=A0ACC3D948_9PEZI|nr:hypothetical protein LTS18_013651 [Coniosporium uncinatum]